MSPAAAGPGNGDEEQPLLAAHPQPRKKASWRQRMTADVRRDRADIVLLLCYIITGLLDSASISAWGSFVSMQTGTFFLSSHDSVCSSRNVYQDSPNLCYVREITGQEKTPTKNSTDVQSIPLLIGNTVYFGLGLAAPHESTRWIKSGTSLGCFCVGSVFFSTFHRRFSPKRRWVLCASFALQMALVVGAAAIVTFGPALPPDANPRESIAWTVLAPIALVAFQSCGQAVTSRALKYNALTSVVLTSIYCDLFSDANSKLRFLLFLYPLRRDTANLACCSTGTAQRRAEPAGRRAAVSPLRRHHGRRGRAQLCRNRRCPVDCCGPQTLRSHHVVCMAI